MKQAGPAANPEDDHIGPEEAYLKIISFFEDDVLLRRRLRNEHKLLRKPDVHLRILVSPSLFPDAAAGAFLVRIRRR
jgi:hypothetical protein